MTKNITSRMHYPIFLLGLVFIMSISGCTKEAKTADVEKIANELFAALLQKDYDRALTFYSKEFFSLTPPEAWLAHLKDVNSKLGDLQVVKLKTKSASTIFSGRRFIFIFTNRYKNGLAKETVIFFQSIKDQVIKVHSHKIESSLLPGSRR